MVAIKYNPKLVKFADRKNTLVASILGNIHTNSSFITMNDLIVSGAIGSFIFAITRGFSLQS